MDTFVWPGLGVHAEILQLERAEGIFRAGFCLAHTAWPALRGSCDQFLHPEEREHFAGLKFERRQMSYLAGRFCAKQALWQIRPEVSPVAISIRNGVFQQPVVSGVDGNMQVSISHASDWGAAVAFPEQHPMAIAIEEVREERAAVIRSQVTDAEYGLAALLAGSQIRTLTLLWTVKEAMAKAIRCGMMTPFALFQIASAEPVGDAIVCTFTNFAQYKATSYLLPVKYNLRPASRSKPHGLLTPFGQDWQNLERLRDELRAR